MTVWPAFFEFICADQDRHLGLLFFGPFEPRVAYGGDVLVNRRSFLASIIALVAAPFVARVSPIKPLPACGCKACDPTRVWPTNWQPSPPKWHPDDKVNLAP